MAFRKGQVCAALRMTGFGDRNHTVAWHARHKQPSKREASGSPNGTQFAIASKLSRVLSCCLMHSEEEPMARRDEAKHPCSCEAAVGRANVHDATRPGPTAGGKHPQDDKAT